MRTGSRVTLFSPIGVQTSGLIVAVGLGVELWRNWYNVSEIKHNFF